MPITTRALRRSLWPLPADARSANLSYASVDTFENIRVVAPLAPRAMAMAMAAATPAPTEEFTPQSVTVTAHVNAMFVRK